MPILGILCMYGAIYGLVGFSAFIPRTNLFNEEDIFFFRVMEIGGFAIFFICMMVCLGICFDWINEISWIVVLPILAIVLCCLQIICDCKNFKVND